MMENNQISLNASLITRVLVIAAFLLLLADIAGVFIKYFTAYEHVYKLINLFDFDRERNIPTGFSAFLLVFAAQLLAVITLLEKKRTSLYWIYWAILSFGFFIMAVDEVFAYHEKSIDPLSKLLGGGNLGVFHFTWVVPAILFVFFLALFYLKFLLRLPSKTRLSFLIAAALYLGGTIGCELIGGHIYELHGIHNLTYGLITTLEESLEIAGTIVFIWALLVYITSHYKDVQFRFRST